MDDMRSLVTKEIPHLMRFAHVLVGRDVCADDLVQDALELAWRKRRLWRKTGSLRSWMLRILYRTYVNSLRSADRRGVEFDERWHTDMHGSSASAQESHMELDDFARAMDSLCVEQRAAVSLVALEGMTYEAAADALDVPVNTLRSRLFRGRAELSRMMEQGDSVLRPRLRRIK